MTSLIKTSEWTGKQQPVEMTDALIEAIARQNEYMTPDEVRKALLAGKTVCTELSRYKLAGEQ